MTGRSRRRTLKLAAGAAVVGAVWLACAEPNAHIFIAGQYLAQLDCVTPGEAVDVLDGPPTDASCEATCVVPTQSDGAVYITGACAPFPPGDFVDGSPLCAKGLAAIRRSDLCLDGGPSNPLPEAGPAEAAAASDATSDASQEASAVGPSRDASGDVRD